jgi:DNA-3-methyladenine glycosylase II
MDKVTTAIRPTSPFDFDLTAGYRTYYRGSYGTDSLDQGVYRRLLDLGDKLVLATVRSVGSVEAPELTVELAGEKLSPVEVSAAETQVAWLMGAKQELSAFYSVAQNDPLLSRTVDTLYGLHLPQTATVFEALVLSVLGQQIASNVARIVRTLLIETYGPHQTFDGQEYYSFPRPETICAVSLEELRLLKLSQRKAEYIKGIAEVALDGAALETLHCLSGDEVIQRVTALRGVGHWTAQWLLVMALSRPDAFPSGDLALQRVISNRYFDGQKLSAEQIEEFSRRWSPFRTYATAYMFTALRRGRG